jgi:hypothetical protein
VRLYPRHSIQEAKKVTTKDTGSYYKVLLCPECGEETYPDRIDDAKTQWYKCGKGHQTATPKKVQKNALSPKETKEYYSEEESKKESQADRLVNLCLSQAPVFFHDQHKTPFVRVRQKDVNVIMPIRSRQFKTFLANLMWQTEEKVPGNEGLNSAINVLQGKALLEGKQFTLYNRVAPAEDGFWIDMSDDKWRAIKVDAQGWRIVNNPPIMFRRYSHQLPLTEPVHGGDPWRLLVFFNIKEEDNETRLTLMCACASYYVPLIPHPILVLSGIQGSGKSWLFKLKFYLCQGTSASEFNS